MPEEEKWGPEPMKILVWIEVLHPDGTASPGRPQAADEDFKKFTQDLQSADTLRC